MSSASMRRAVTVSMTAGVGALGVAAESVAYSGSAVRSWALDLAVGCGLVALGVVGRRIAADSRCGPLLCAAGYAWFAGNFANADVAELSWIGSHGAYVHRAILAHAIVGFPRGRLDSPLRRVVVASAYTVALLPALTTSDEAWIAVSAAVLVTTVINRREAAPAALAFALATGGIAADRLFLAPLRDGRLLFYEAGILAAGSLLVVALWRRATAPTVADRVVELGEAATLQEALRDVLGDPSLEIGFRQDSGYVDEQGRALEPKTAGRRATALGAPAYAVLVHDPSTEIDRSTTDAISRALASLTENAHLQAKAYEQLAELRASRRRLVLARGRQRAVMARRLRDGVETRLTHIEAALVKGAPTEPELVASIDRASRRLAEVRGTIAALAHGLQPPVLATGLSDALHALAVHSPAAVSLTVDERRFDAAVEQATYLVCAEALSNVAKHARASQVEVRLVANEGTLRLEISDNGRGGADPRGNGLFGVSERIEELGGRLHVQSAPGRGTHLAVEIPLPTEPNLPGRLEWRPVILTPAGAGHR